MKKINSLIQWWVTPKLPPHDVYAKHNIFSQWLIHPIKRRLARRRLLSLQKNTRIKVIGITGSAGKTTTKEMLAAILKLDGKTVYSIENIDPVYNIPNTVLKCGSDTKYLILEMGVEYPGEMDFYLWLAKPDIGIITNIFPTHTEFLGNIEGVFKEKSKLVLSLTDDDTAVLNEDDKKLKSLTGKISAKTIWFPSDTDPFVENSNAARVAAKVFGIKGETIEKGLVSYKKPPHRLQIIKHKSGAMIIDDSYNSNPWAAIETLEYFKKIAKGRRVAVLGDMLELGEYDETGHRELGRKVAKSGFDTVIGVGNSSKFLIDEVRKGSGSTKTGLFSGWKFALPAVKVLLGKDTSVLVKGSRSMNLDKLVDALS